MKHIAIVALSCVLAVGVSAQQQAAPSLFDQAVAAEDLEHDLDKALGLYREAFDKAVADDNGDKMRISGRLYHLLRRLGRDDELKAFGERLATMGMSVRVFDGEGDGQDPEREKELRKKTRELLGRLGHAFGRATSSPVCRRTWKDQLLWIGPAAVPELIAELDHLEWPDLQKTPQKDTSSVDPEDAVASRSPRRRLPLDCAAVLERPRLRAVVRARWWKSMSRARCLSLFDNPDEQTVVGFLEWMADRLAPGKWMEAAEGRGAPVQERVKVAAIGPAGPGPIRRRLAAACACPRAARPAGADPKAGRRGRVLVQRGLQRDVEAANAAGAAARTAATAAFDQLRSRSQEHAIPRSVALADRGAPSCHRLLCEEHRGVKAPETPRIRGWSG
ncbi:MAG: hypothetical protein R3F29_11105 [Planctomycetota bacterium]